MPTTSRESLLVSARLQRLPTTRYTCAFVLLLAGALIIEAFDIGSLSVILPILKPLMYLSALQVGMLAASSAVGITIGMIPAGLLADRFGRRRVLIGGMLWFSGLTLVSALAPDFRTLLLLRGLSGLGMGAIFIVPYALLVELVSSRARAGFAGVLESALGIGYVAVPIVGLVVLPSFAPDIAWRVFLLIAGLPIVYVWVLWKYLPESPRWLSRVGRLDEAERIVAAIEERVERLAGAALPQPVARELEMPLGGERQPVGLRTALEVWKPPYLVRTITMTTGAFGTFALFYVAVNYIPSLFEAKSIGLSNALILSLMVTSSQIPGKLLNGVLSDFLGRKLTYALFASIALVGAYFFGQSSDPIVMMGWGCLFLFAASGSAPSYKMWYAEQYPTPIRAIGQSTCESIGGKLLGGVVWTAVFPVLVEALGIGTTMTFIAVMGLITLLVVVAFAPETAGRSVEELEGEPRRPLSGLMDQRAPSHEKSELA
jgi:MFS transporter, putative metabolite:H+ symporter